MSTLPTALDERFLPFRRFAAPLLQGTKRLVIYGVKTNSKFQFPLRRSSNLHPKHPKSEGQFSIKYRIPNLCNSFSFLVKVTYM